LVLFPLVRSGKELFVADGDPATPWWWDHLAAQASDLRAAGFAAVWLPPVLKTAFGSKPAADGHAPFDDYDIGSRNQKVRCLPVMARASSCSAVSRCCATGVLRRSGPEFIPG
jgi:hypothetical protein